MTNSGRASFAGIRECKLHRRRKFRRRPRSPWFEILSYLPARRRTSEKCGVNRPYRILFSGLREQRTAVTPDFIALWIWNKMRSSAFCSVAPQTPSSVFVICSPGLCQKLVIRVTKVLLNFEGPLILTQFGLKTADAVGSSRLFLSSLHLKSDRPRQSKLQ